MLFRSKPAAVEIDLAATPIRALNRRLHGVDAPVPERVVIRNPEGTHNIAVGLDAPVEIEVAGPVGYFLGGCNKQARIVVDGHAGRSVGENIMSGEIRIRGHASESVGATGRGGFVVVEGNAGSRCGISMKGVDIVVRGDVGHMSAFMAQAGRLVVCGDAGPGLGDSLYEAVIYVGGTIAGLGADARVEPMSEDDHRVVAELLARAGFDLPTAGFKRVASARSLYNWNVDADQEY